MILALRVLPVLKELLVRFQVLLVRQVLKVPKVPKVLREEHKVLKEP